jgi:hypothetical protein
MSVPQSQREIVALAESSPRRVSQNNLATDYVQTLFGNAHVAHTGFTCQRPAHAHAAYR